LDYDVIIVTSSALFSPPVTHHKSQVTNNIGTKKMYKLSKLTVTSLSVRH